ncbi:hypothetical protein BGZ94_009133 [Podila epigama]|nr:hypothetical protein BGZ94_009133 [Podila epigama]
MEDAVDNSPIWMTPKSQSRNRTRIVKNLNTQGQNDVQEPDRASVGGASGGGTGHGEALNDDNEDDGPVIVGPPPRRRRGPAKTRLIASLQDNGLSMRAPASSERLGPSFMKRAEEHAATKETRSALLPLSNARGASSSSMSSSASSSSAADILPARPFMLRQTRRKVDIRVSAMAKQSQKLVDEIRTQYDVSDFESMTLRELREVAVTFGLKATRRPLLMEQLTAIWHKLNPEPRVPPAPAPVDLEKVNSESESESESELRAEFASESELVPELGPESQPRPFRDGLAQLQKDNFQGLSRLRQDDGGQRYNGKGKGLAGEYGPSYPRRSQYQTEAFGEDEESLVLLGDQSASAMSEGDASIDSDEDIFDEEQDEEDDEEEEEGTDDRSSSGGRGGNNFNNGDGEDDDDGGKKDDDGMETLLGQESDSVPASSSDLLERQLYTFLHGTPHLRKQYLMYKPLDLEVVWNECQVAKIDCTRKELRQFLDRRGILCIVPAESTLGSWRKTRATKRRK